MSTPMSDEDVTAAMQHWRQGDYILGDFDFVAIGSEGDAVLESCSGYILVTQTCDCVRPVADRDLVEVAALKAVNEEFWHEVFKARRPRFATVERLKDCYLVADLDRVMTVSKRHVARWPRQPGCSSDKETRALRHALARKRGRMAFPDDFVEAIKRLQQLWVSKHGKSSPEGEAITALREIRVVAAPDWSASVVEVVLYLIWEDDLDLSRHRHLVGTWATRLRSDGGRFAIELKGVALDGLSARSYVDSDPLDLDHLTLMTAQQ